jgi:hypothetical protein
MAFERKLLYLSGGDVEELSLSMRNIIDVVALALAERRGATPRRRPSIGSHPERIAASFLPSARHCQQSRRRPASGRADRRATPAMPYITGLLILNEIRIGCTACNHGRPC